MIHELKTLSNFYEDVKSGKKHKTVEIVADDVSFTGSKEGQQP